MKYINGINENTYDLLFDDEYLDVDAIDFESSAKLATMEIFTKLRNRGLKYKLLKMYYKNTILDINKIESDKMELIESKYKSSDITKDAVSSLISPLNSIILFFRSLEKIS